MSWSVRQLWSLLLSPTPCYIVGGAATVSYLILGRLTLVKESPIIGSWSTVNLTGCDEPRIVIDPLGWNTCLCLCVSVIKSYCLQVVLLVNQYSFPILVQYGLWPWFAYPMPCQYWVIPHQFNTGKRYFQPSCKKTTRIKAVKIARTIL
jgi:hypothetical protein